MTKVRLALCLSLTACVPLVSAQVTPDNVARQMVDERLPVGYKGMRASEATIPKGDKDTLVKEWQSLLAPDATPNAYVMFVFNYLGNLKPMYPKGEFSQEMASTLTERLRNLPADVIQSWSNALKLSTGIDAPAMALRFELIQIPWIWEGGRFRQDRRDLLIRRASGIPKDAIDHWGDFGMGSLMQVPSLFTEDRFNRSLFDRALPIAQKFYEERVAALNLK